MNDQDHDAPVPAAETKPSAAEAPKRKRAPRKTVASRAPADADPAPDAAAVAQGDATGEQQATAPAEAVRPARTRTRKPAQAADAVAQGEPSEAAPTVRAEEPAVGAAAASTMEPSQHALAEAGAGKGRNRNRRRGRRGGDRPEPAQLLAAATPAAGELFEQVLTGRFDAEAEAEAALGRGVAESEEAAQAAAEATPAEPSDMSITVLGAEPAVAQAQAALPAEAGEQGPARRVLAPEADAPKLHKVLAQSGVGSRRDLEQMIASGRVTVNDEVAHTGQRISWGDRIAIDGKPVRVRIAPPAPRVLAYHKPAGEVVTHDDPQQRPTVFRRLPRLQQGKWQSVGRLDINTEGLLLFTNSGELANQLMHPRFGIEREYAVRSLGTLGAEAKAKLLEGLAIDGQTCAFKSIEDGGGEGVNHWYRCVITEGRNREVRRLFEAVGHAVSRLIRIRYGSVVLPRGLKRGVWVDLDERDLRNLRSLAGAGAAAAARAGKPAGLGDGEPPGAPEAARDDSKTARKRRGRGRKGEPGLSEVQTGGRGPREGRSGPPQARGEPGPREPREPRRLRGGPDGADGDNDLPPGFIPDPLQTSLPALGVKRSKLPQPQRRAHDDRDLDDDGSEGQHSGPIPNPLQQTYDKRAIQQARARRREIAEDGPIPNPLQQTYDQRALLRDRMPQREVSEDGPIPNPLQQTYDKRFASGGGSGLGKPAGGRGKRGGAARQGAAGSGAGYGPNAGLGAGGKSGGGRGKAAGGGVKGTGKPGVGRGNAKGGKPGKAGGARQPDPLQTAVGYIGGDAYLRKGGGKPRRGGGGGAGGVGGPAGPAGGKPRGGRGGRPR